MILRICIIFVAILQLNATLLFWSSKDIQIPSLKYFKEEDFENLLIELNNPHIIAFQNSYRTIDNIPRTVGNLYSSYVPNGNMYIENVTELNEDVDQNMKLIQDSIENFNNNNKNLKKILIIISSPNIRAKRHANNIANGIVADKNKLSQQVLYYNINTGSGMAMIYSSKYLLLKTTTNNYTLKDTKKTTLTNIGSYSVLAATFPLEKLSITLKFKFQNSWGYWTLPVVQVDGIDTKSITLNASKTIRAEKNYSYHCFGETLFKDNQTELILYDIQVQPYTKNRKFSEAYDCVPFTTVPIWSGLVVSFTFILGLFLGFGALANIKTMDKFDTCRTKQLSLTVTE